MVRESQEEGRKVWVSYELFSCKMLQSQIVGRLQTSEAESTGYAVEELEMKEDREVEGFLKQLN